jgi:transcription elongation factor B subunit 1
VPTRQQPKTHAANWGTTCSSVVLDKVVDYFHYWYRYRNSDDVPDMDIPVEICLELLSAADYLGLDPANPAAK